MTMVCPHDGYVCLDDLCRGNGCLKMDCYPMLVLCEDCGGTIDDTIPECSTCTCEDEDIYMEDDAA